MQPEHEDGGDIGGEVGEFGRDGPLQEPEAQERDDRDDEERAGAGPENPVVEPTTSPINADRHAAPSRCSAPRGCVPCSAGARCTPHDDHRDQHDRVSSSLG